MAKAAAKKSTGEGGEGLLSHESMKVVWAVLAALILLGIYLAIPGTPEKMPVSKAPSEPQAGTPGTQEAQQPATPSPTKPETPSTPAEKSQQ